MKTKQTTSYLLLILFVASAFTCNAQSQSNNLDSKKDSISKQKMNSEDHSWVAYEQMPQFPGGDEALLSFVYKNLKYPKKALKQKIQGKVVLRFVVSTEGKVEKVDVLRSLEPSCDKEAIRVVKLLPDFIPGSFDGKKVAVWYTLPVTFKL